MSTSLLKMKSILIDQSLHELIEIWKISSFDRSDGYLNFIRCFLLRVASMEDEKDNLYSCQYTFSIGIFEQKQYPYSNLLFWKIKTQNCGSHLRIVKNIQEMVMKQLKSVLVK